MARDETQTRALVPSRARAPFGWYGSKARLAPHIVALAASIPHRVYIEPYAGSAAVLFAKPRAPVEIINDIDGQVVHFFRMLRDRPAELARACQLTPYARGEYEAAEPSRDGTADLSEIEQARRFWVRCTQSFNNGGAGRRAGWAISSAPGSNEAQSAAGLARQLETIAARLAGVYVEHGEALAVIARHAGPDVLIYADPPYLAQTRTGRQRARLGDYRHEASDSHHEALGQALRATSAAVLISGYDHPLYREMYDGWHQVPVRVAKPSGNHSSTAARHATEVIWSNRTPAGHLTLFPTLTPGCDETTPPDGSSQPGRDETPGPSCRDCDHPVTAAATGRPRLYCSRACQARAYRKRAAKRAAEMPDPGHTVNP
jgi:DNA adenine methylase